MPFVNNFSSVNFMNKSTQATGTPDLDAAWLNYIQSIINAQGNGLATYSSDLEALESTVSGLGGPYTDPMYISGLGLEYVSTTQIRVKSGACYIPATASIVQKTTDTTLTPTGLVANTWYYIYGTNVGGVLAFDNASTTAPAAYFGTAKQKSGDSTRRFIGAFRTNASSQIISFQTYGNFYGWRVNHWIAPFRVVDNGNATALTTITLTVVPATCVFAWASQALASGPKIFLGTSDKDDMIEVVAGTAFSGPLTLNSSQQFQYRNGSSGSGTYIDIGGYYLDR